MGYLNYNNIVDGKIFSFKNLGVDLWATTIDKMSFGDKKIGNTHKLALVDSTKSSLSIPEKYFNDILQELPPTLFEKQEYKDGSILMSANLNCTDANRILKEISLTLDETVIKIKPEGYTW